MVKKRNSSKSKAKAATPNKNAETETAETETAETETAETENVENVSDGTVSDKIEVVASESDDGIAVGIEEVEAEIVGDDGGIVDVDDDKDGVDASATSLDDDVKVDGHDVDEVPEAAVIENEASKAPLSPGIVFLGVLGVIGIMGAGLWMKKSNDDQVATSNAVVSPLDQASSSPKTSTQKASAKIGTTDKDAINGASKNSKIANTVSDQDVKNDVTIAAEQAKVAAVDESKINSLPNPPTSQAQEVIAQTQAAAKEAAKQVAAGVESEVSAPVEGIVEGVVDDAKETTQSLAPSLISPAEEAADLFASDPKDVTNDSQPTQTVQFEANTPTPEEQLGADPAEAIKLLQEEADARLIAQEDEKEETILETPTSSEATTSSETTELTIVSATEEGIEDTGLTGAESVLAEIDAVGDIATAEEAAISLANDSELNATELNTSGAETENTISGAVATFDGGPTRSDEVSPEAPLSAQDPDIFDAQNQAVAQVTDKFAGEIAALEENFEERTSRITEALNFERERAARQAEEIANLKSQLEQTLAANEQRSNENIENLRTRIDALQNDEAEKATTTERQTASLLSLISLQRSFDQGVSFERELGVLKNAMPNGQRLTALEKAAATGAPTMATLKENFPDAIRTTLAGSQKGAKGPMGHFMRNIKSLVSVRPSTPQEGDAVPAIISRAEDYLLRDDLSNALREVGRLNSAASPDMVEWIEKAQLRHNAVLSLNTINDNLLSGIGN